MKHLKLFEDLDYEYYKSISWNEYMKAVGYENGNIQFDYIRDKYEKFTQKEINEICEILDEYGNFEIVVHSRGDISVGNKDESYERFEITKLSDEWFYLGDVKDDGEAYRCDQFDGLLKCIEDVI